MKNDIVMYEKGFKVYENVVDVYCGCLEGLEPSRVIKTYSIETYESNREILFSTSVTSPTGLARAITEHVGSELLYNLVIEPLELEEEEWEEDYADYIQDNLEEFIGVPKEDQELLLVRDSTGTYLTTLHLQTWTASKTKPGRVFNVKMYLEDINVKE